MEYEAIFSVHSLRMTIVLCGSATGIQSGGSRPAPHSRVRGNRRRCALRPHDEILTRSRLTRRMADSRRDSAPAPPERFRDEAHIDRAEARISHALVTVIGDALKQSPDARRPARSRPDRGRRDAGHAGVARCRACSLSSITRLDSSSGSRVCGLPQPDPPHSRRARRGSG